MRKTNHVYLLYVEFKDIPMGNNQNLYNMAYIVTYICGNRTTNHSRAGVSR